MLIKNAIMNAAITSIDNHVSTNQAKKKELSPQMDETFNHVKYLNKLLNHTSNNKLERYFPTLVERWNSTVRSLNSLATKFKYDYTFPDNIHIASFPIIRDHKYLSGLIQHRCDCLFKSFQDKQIKRFIQKRCDDYYDNKKHMIDSFLECNKCTIVIDRVLQTKDNCQTLVTDPNEIKKLTNEHFQTCAGGIHHDEEIPDYWKPQYALRSDIDANIYSYLMTDITNQEWANATRQLPLNKATGPSGISNEMIKHLGPKMSQAIIFFLNACIRLNDIPSAWREANVYPIPKPKEWECNLNNTRPITLLEVLRKLMVRILNTRLATLFIRYKVLKGNQFAGLPGSSTFEPIRIINEIIEDAKEKHNDLWILFQDMSKAYDRVNIFMLKKAMARLRSPPSFIDLICNLFTQRKNRVFTSVGTTSLMMYL
jgi:hypothetical protein